jgi:hypothetical protein
LTSLILILMFGALALLLLDGNWRGGLMATMVIGFLQDPLRKMTPGQPSSMVGLVLAAFLLTLFVIYERAQGRINLRAMFWTVPAVREWVPIYMVLILVQALNSTFRFGDLRLTGLGIAFYLAPAVAIWVGFQVGCTPKLVPRLLATYLVMCSIFAFTAWLDFQGVQNPLFKEVGQGIQITFEGFSAEGATGLWRTSEIAAWHLAAGSCFALILAMSNNNRLSQMGLVVLAAGFAYLTIPTGRRKALVLVLIFAAFYLLLFSRKASPDSRERVISTLLGGAGLTYAAYALFLITAKGDNFDLYLNRALSAKDELLNRFQSQGVGALMRALEVSGGYGLGVGAGANIGNLEINQNAQALRSSIQSLGYVSEGGGGRIVAELGLPGLLIGGMLAILILMTIQRNFKLVNIVGNQEGFILLGLVSFALANVVFFFSAAQVYSDPFILIMLGLSFGSYLAIPTLIARQQALAAQVQRNQLGPVARQPT